MPLVPEVMEVPELVLFAVWSSGEDATSPGTNSTFAARAVTDWWEMVMVLPERAVVTRADRTTVRTPSAAVVVGLLATSLSTVNVLCGVTLSVAETAVQEPVLPDGSSIAKTMMMVLPTAAVTPLIVVVAPALSVAAVAMLVGAMAVPMITLKPLEAGEILPAASVAFA